MTTEDAPESTETTETSKGEHITPENAPETPESQPDTFDRPYVEGLRKENAAYRDRAKTAEGRVEELCRELVTAKIAATGRLADPTDLPLSAEDVSMFLDDPSTIDAAIDVLLESKPHLAARKPVGDIGQGQRGQSGQPFSLIGALKGV